MSQISDTNINCIKLILPPVTLNSIKNINKIVQLHLNNFPYKFHIGLLGSLSRLEGTICSDIDWILLLDNKVAP